MKLLDCTLRDGGHQNNWKFPMEFAKGLCKAVNDAGVDFIEIGLLYPQSKEYGIFKSVGADLVDCIMPKNSKTKVAAMIDYGKCDFDLDLKVNSRIDMVRVASHKKDIHDAIKYAEKLKELGYVVSIQAMNFSSYSKREILSLALHAGGSEIDYICVADSFGRMRPQQVRHSIMALMGFSFDIGFHPHNNIGLAVANSLEAIDAGANVLDATLLGVGRGAGNLPLELASLLDMGDIDPKPILDIIEMHRGVLEHCGFYANCEYAISGSLGCHPDRVKEMRNKGMKYSEILEALA